MGALAPRVEGTERIEQIGAATGGLRRFTACEPRSGRKCVLTNSSTTKPHESRVPTTVVVNSFARNRFLGNVRRRPYRIAVDHSRIIRDVTREPDRERVR